MTNPPLPSPVTGPTAFESKPARRPRRSPEDWARLVAQHAASDLNVAAFCRTHNLGVASFYAWQQRLHQPEDVAHAANPSPAHFLRLESSASLADPITATFPGDVTITVGLDALEPLVAALRKTASC